MSLWQDKRLLIEFDSRFYEMGKGVGVEFISYQPLELWPRYANHKVKTTYYMAVYSPDNWRFTSDSKPTGIHRVRVEKSNKYGFKSALVTDSDKKTDFLISPNKKSAKYFAYSCDPPGGRNSYAGETWYRLDKSVDDGRESLEVLFKEDLSDMVVIRR